MENVLIGMDHPAIAFKDLETCCKWYCEKLDFEVVAEVENNGAKLLKCLDGTFIEAMPSDGTERPQRSFCGEGVSHLAFRVRNLEEAVKVLESRGIEWTGGVKSAVGGGFVRNFQDPEGNELQLVER